MKVILAAAAGLGAVSMPLAAEDGPPGSATCFIEVRALMAEPPSGIADLGSAIHELDLKLRPQVEEITRLKQVVAQLEVRHQQAMQRDEEGADPLQLEEDARKMRSDLHARQAQLKLDYAAQRKAIVGPVQARISERARAYADGHGCADLKMARTPDLAGLTSDGAKNVTGEFVAWYALNKS